MPSILGGIGSANPVIGVFIDHLQRVTRPGPGSIRLGQINHLCRALNATAYFFTPQDINYRKLLINGLFFDEKRNSWRKQFFLFPDILYLHSGLEKMNRKEMALFHAAVKACKARPIGGPLEFNKWEVYRVLSGSGSLKQHLPETRLFHNTGSDLAPMLKRYGAVYLKACRGRRGEQVMQLSWEPEQTYRCCYYVEKLVVYRSKKFDHIFQMIHNFFGNRDFIVQQPIDLIEYQGKKVDLRAEIQKNGKGALEIAGIPVRVARENSPITTHAQSYRFENFFLELMGYSKEKLQELSDNLNRIINKIFYQMENCYGELAEMGIDLGLDKKGALWIIECNAFSALVSLGKAYKEETVWQAFANVLDYAFFRQGKR